MNKMSVIIADDDHLVLQNFKTLVNWKNLGFQISATATNGMEALKLIEAEPPHLLITDVIMPIMNGLELIEQVSEKFPDMKILIISSYDEFEYAKKAIEKGVTDYILKTEITATSFSAKLTSIYRQLTSRIQITAIALNRELTQFFEDGTHLAEHDELYPSLRKTYDNRYQFFIIAQALGFSKSLETILEYRKKSAQYLFNTVQEIKDLQTAPILFTVMNFCILGIPIESSRSNQLFLTKSLSKKILLNLNSRSSHPCVLFYSDYLITLIQMRSLFYKNQDLFNFHAAFPINSLLCVQSIGIKAPAYTDSDFSFYKLSFESVHFENDILKIKAFLTELYEAMDYSAILKFYQNFCTHIEITSNHHFRFNGQMFFESLEPLLKWIFNTYNDCINYLSKNQSQEYSPYVDEAIRVIQRDYPNNNLTAGMISGCVAVSTSRLSVLFKEETGKTINEYLTDVRIKNAIYYLSNTNMKIYEISDKCGYKSSQYFSQIFYQKTGKRPIDYRRKNG